MVGFGVRMPKEPSILRMDWKALGYERVYVDGKVRWIPQQVKDETK